MDPKTEKNIQRLDWFDNFDMTEPASSTDEGFIHARAVVTTIGVYTYKREDGTYVRELRLPEEVFAEESLATLRLKPLALIHPDNPVTPDNAKELIVGNLGDGVMNDAYSVIAPIAINAREAVDAVKNRQALALSCGYTCDIEWTAGTMWGMDYDCIQRNIRYNHVALVPAGRAGDTAVIKMDRAEVRVDCAGRGTIPKLNNNKQEPTMELQNLHIDGADYKAEAKVVDAYNALGDKLTGLDTELAQVKKDAKDAADKAAQELSAVTAERDMLKGRCDAAEAELKTMGDKVAAGVAARLDMLDKAKLAGVEVKADMSDDDVKCAIIAKVNPNFNKDGKDAGYITACFDMAVAALLKEGENNSRRDAAEPPAGSSTLGDELAKARAAHSARMDNAWRDNKEA